MECGRAAPISLKAERTMDSLLESNPEFTALKFIGRTSEEVVAITKALRDNSSITALYEMEGGENGLTDEGLKQLGKVLQLNPSITKLHIASDAITHEGVSVFTGGLLKSSSVTKLSLWSRSIGDEGVVHLARLIGSEDCGMTELYLNLPSVSQQSLDSLREAISMNSTLLRCQLEM
eukprot:TRINITY_DN28311_c0_g1_i3.p1 TRINITY_DN28311_c0_g1~~TRINITY_DN28311_c0_g1_i3.p1  ORF type:complete len:177 (+),score=35.21 TRINITY_DN28311_c0_g1_i3:270-800(+)